MDEIGKRRTDDRLHALWEQHVEQRWYRFKRRYQVYRTWAIAAFVVVFAVLFLHALSTLTRAMVSGWAESNLERELGFALIPVEKVALLKYRDVADYAEHGRRRPCTEIPIEDMWLGRTAPANGSDQRHQIVNLVETNHHIMVAHSLAYAAPPMFSMSDVPSEIPRPDACILSIILEREFKSEVKNPSPLEKDQVPDHMLDALNPREVEWIDDGMAHDHTSTRMVKFVDIMFADSPSVRIESIPRLALQFRTADGQMYTLRLTDIDAHMARAALRLLTHGEPVSAWGLRARDNAPTIRKV